MLLLYMEKYNGSYGQIYAPNGSYSVSDIIDYFEYILTKHVERTDNLSIRIYVNRK